MITKKLITEIEKFVYSEVKKYGAPSKEQVEYSVNVGQKLAEKLKVNKKIVYLGTLLMDCKLGESFKKGELSEHVQMSVEKTQDILESDKDLTKDEKENTINCVCQHHGAEKFYSKESEVVCNADCYKFSSVEGFLISFRFTRDMPFERMISLLSEKADEKWNALSLDICKKELEPQYKLIKKLLDYYEA